MGVRVGIVGAGIGGLTLAHALRRHGIECVVFDRDAGPDATAGYRLHLTAAAYATLTDTLPPASLRALADCGTGTFEQFAVLDHRGVTRLRIPMTHPGDVLMIGRRPLRAILARGLEDVIRWGSPVRDLGELDEFDAVVAADGTGSRIAEQWVGRPTAQPAGVVGIAGRAVLPQRIPRDLRRGLAFAIGPGGVGAFLSLHGEHGSDPAAERPYVVWSVAASAPLPEGDLSAVAHGLMNGWAPDFHTLVDSSDPGSVAAFPFYFPAALEPWPVGRVTLLGDAIHPMPPTAGAGASTAIIDAAHLGAYLATRPVTEAMAIYQRRLLQYAPAAVDEARPPLTWQRRLANPALLALATNVGLPAADLVIRLLSRRR